MRTVKAVLAAVAATLVTAVPAQAQSEGSTSVILFGIPSGGTLISETSVPIQVAGQLVVSFHGDIASGCAASGLCGYTGTIVLRPRSGTLGVAKFRTHGRIEHQASLGLEPGDQGYLTAAQVQRSVPGQPAGLCADTQSQDLDAITGGALHGGALTVSVLAPGGTLLSTRCAGPLDGDVAGAGPRATISLRAAMRGRSKIDLTATHTFASHGFAGTVTSTLVLTLGKPVKQGSNPPLPPGIKQQRIRTVTEQLKVTRVTGGMSASVQGTTDPVVCRLLDSCGLSGTLSLGQPARAGALATLAASGPANRPYRDFLTALGLSGGGRTRGINVDAVFALPKVGGITADLTQSGTCTDTAPVDGLFGSLRARGGALSGSAATEPWRTRCPGPLVADQSPLLSATAPVGALGRRTFTIELRPLGPLVEDGYTLALHGHIALVVRRGRVTQSVQEVPGGFGS